jgi:hypothetical protein
VRANHVNKALIHASKRKIEPNRAPRFFQHLNQFFASGIQKRALAHNSVGNDVIDGCKVRSRKGQFMPTHVKLLESGRRGDLWS